MLVTGIPDRPEVARRSRRAPQGCADDGLCDDGRYGARAGCREGRLELGGLARDEGLVCILKELLAVGVTGGDVIHIWQEQFLEVGPPHAVPGQRQRPHRCAVVGLLPCYERGPLGLSFPHEVLVGQLHRGFYGFGAC